MAKSSSIGLNYWQRNARSSQLPPIGGSEIEEYRPECIVTEKVYDECTVCECPTFRFMGLEPAPANVVSCEVKDVRIVPDPSIPRDGEVEFTLEWDQEVVYTDAEGYDHVVCRTFRFKKRIRLRGARVGMNLRFFHLVRCLNCRVRETAEPNREDFIECEVGLFIVVKVTFTVQLEIERARFCPQPPECVQVSPIGCPEWADLCERGEFWPPFPPQID
ncbi:MAG TPA: hypothetical protein GXX29_13765 [Firmicutes bacterium]|nr:hypothetical protein [Bacillota bacterium]